MKQSNLFIVLTLFFSPLCAQVTITTGDLPNEGDILIQRNALLIGEFDLEDSGPDHSWIFDEEILQSTDILTNTPCLPEDEAPFLYQILFNNPFFPEHNADFAFGVDDFNILGIAFNDNYWFIQNNDEYYSSVGFATTINDIPLPTTIDPVDIIYELPLDYDDAFESPSNLLIEIPGLGAYGLTQHRTTIVDGWGNAELWGESFPVLRVRSEIHASDSVYIDFIQLGQSIDRPVAVEYKWLTPQFNVPLVQINTTGGFVSMVQTADLTVGISETLPLTFEAYPNPCSGNALTLNTKMGGELSIFDTNGKEVIRQNILPGKTGLDVELWNSGEYFALIQFRDGSTSVSKIVLQ